MDNSNLNPQTPIANTPPPQPAAAQNTSPEPVSGDSNKMILWLVIGLIIVIASVGGIYLFLNRQQAASQTLKPSPLTSQTPIPQEDLEKDLRGIDIDSGADSDFSSIDQDLQSL